jgi:hypothetical protein
MSKEPRRREPSDEGWETVQDSVGARRWLSPERCRSHGD